MLAYVLALIVGLSSFALYMAAFFFPEIYRKNDFIWSGVGLFYALVLWVCAGRITGGVLLGQVASAALLGWLGWQTVMMRRQQTPTGQQTTLPTAEEVQGALSNLTKPETLTQIPSQLSQQVSQLAGRIQTALKQSASQAGRSIPPSSSETTYTPPKPEDFGTAGQRIAEAIQKVDTRIQEAVAEGKDKPDTRIPEVQTAGAELAEVTEDTIRAIDDSTIFDVELRQNEPVEVSSIAAGQESVETIADQVVEAVTDAKQSLNVPRSSTPQVPHPSQVPQSAKGKTSGPLGGLFGQAQSTFKKFTQPKESKPVYVRKQYREEAKATPEVPGQPQSDETSSVVEEIVSEVTFVSADESARLEQAVEELESIFEDEPASHNTEPAESTPRLQNPFDQVGADADSSPPELEPFPPHLPTPELVEAALVDAEEKHLPASPPPTESESKESQEEEIT